MGRASRSCKPPKSRGVVSQLTVRFPRSAFIVSTSLVKMAPRAAAKPSLGVAPAGGREIGLIEVSAEYSGLGAGGLRDSEVEFYPELAELAGRIGGTNFLVLRSTRETRFGTGWISSLTVDVFDTTTVGATAQ